MFPDSAILPELIFGILLHVTVLLYWVPTVSLAVQPDMNSIDGPVADMTAMPEDVLHDVLALLDVRSLAAVSLACRRAWLVTTDRDSLYRPHCELLYGYSELDRSRDQSFADAFRRLRGEFGRYAPDKIDSPRPSTFARAKVRTHSFHCN